MRLRAKRDANEAQIVEYLRRCGMWVLPVSSPGAPDLLCYQSGQWFAIEVKAKTGRLTQLQRQNLDQAAFPVIRSVAEAAKWYRENCLP